MALTIVNPGQYVLGGIDAPQTGIAEQFQAGLRANLERQDARQVMQVRNQEMQLRASQEARAQATFKQQQAAAAAAAARAAEQRAATAELMKTLRTGAPGAAPAAGVRIAPAAPPRTGSDIPVGRQLPGDAQPSFGLPAIPTTGISPAASAAPAITPQTLGLTVPAEMMRPAGVQVASIDPQQLFLTGTEVPQVGATPAAEAAPATMVADAGPVIRPATPEDPNATAFQRDYQRVQSRSDATRVYQQIRTELGLSSNVLNRAYGYFADNPDEAAQRELAGNAAQWFEQNRELLLDNPELLIEAQRDPIGFAARQEITASTGVEPISKETAEAEATGVVPVVETPWGGLQLSYGTPVQEAAAETGGAPSSRFVMAPEKLARDMEVLANQKFRTEALLDFYERTGNAEAFANTLTELNNLETEQWFMGGMNVIVGMQTGDFGPLLGLMQERYAGREVEVRPYTDNTVDIFVDGEALTGANGGRMTWDELATDLRGQYDSVYIQNQQAAAQAEATRSQFVFEKSVEAEMEAQKQVAIEQAKAQFGASAKLELADANSGTYVLTVPGEMPRLMQFITLDNGESTLIDVSTTMGQ